jgi:hypothetical protein
VNKDVSNELSELSTCNDEGLSYIERRLQDWVSRGRQYDSVAKDLEGPGALILLSDDMDSV